MQNVESAVRRRMLARVISKRKEGRPAYFAWRIILAVIIALATEISKANEAYETSGTLVVKRYERDGELSSAWEGSYALIASDNRYALRMALPTALGVRYIQVSSNLRSTFQAERFQPQQQPPPGKTARSRTHAKFEHGDIPNAIEYGGAVQALALGYLLLKDRNNATGGGGLNEARVPDVFRKRALEIGCQILRHEISPVETMPIAIRFLASKRSATDDGVTSNPILVGLIEIRSAEENLPTDMTYEVYSVEGPPLTTILYNGFISSRPNHELFSAISYHSGEEVIVTDQRRTLPVAAHYKLMSGDTIPYVDDGSLTIRRLVAERIRSDAALSNYRIRRDASVAALLISLGIWLGVYLKRHRALKEEMI